MSKDINAPYCGGIRSLTNQQQYSLKPYDPVLADKITKEAQAVIKRAHEEVAKHMVHFKHDPESEALAIEHACADVKANPIEWLANYIADLYAYPMVPPRGLLNFMNTHDEPTGPNMVDLATTQNNNGKFFSTYDTNSSKSSSGHKLIVLDDALEDQDKEPIGTMSPYPLITPLPDDLLPLCGVHVIA